MEQEDHLGKSPKRGLPGKAFKIVLIIQGIFSKESPVRECAPDRL